MTSLKELSEHLGLSRTQVSRAMNDFPDVSDKTRRRVREAAKELGYRPNVLAQRLRSGKSGIVGLVVPERTEQEESNILLEVMLGLATAFWKRDILVVLNVMPEGAKTAEAYIRLARDGALDGFIVLNPNLDDEGFATLGKNAVPFVTHGRHAEICDYPYVDLDNRATGRMLAEHLTELGHRRIALIDGPDTQFFAQEREAGVREALDAVGGTLEAKYIRRGMMTEQLGENAIAALFDHLPEPPTAVIAGNMVVATGAMRALEARGLRIPEDVSFVAHNDDLARYPRENLTPLPAGTRSPFKEAWGLMVDALMNEINDKRGAESQTVLSPVFVEGLSTAAPKPDLAHLGSGSRTTSTEQCA
ncbi:LacI family DNA-binding transcriptional regulator [Paracoccaceae bacterium GXU_MW_L88]